MTRRIINLATYVDSGVGIIAGQSRGKRVRLDEKLDEFDATPDNAVVVIPPDVYSVGSLNRPGFIGGSVI